MPALETGPGRRQPVPAIGPALLWLCAALLLLGSLWLRWPSITYPTTNARDDYNVMAFNTMSYSDIASLFFRDRLATHPRPYFDYPLEYPVGMGLLVYGLNTATQLRSYLLLTTAVLAGCALVTLWLIGRLPAGNRAALALSPALLLYVNLNWDWSALVLTVAALALVQRARPGWAGVLLAVAVWTKFFPIVLVPLVGLAYLVLDQRRALGRFVAGGVVTTIVMNGPLLLLKPTAWWYFFQTNQTRGREVNLWNLFDRWQLSTATINLWSTGLLAVGLVVLLVLVGRYGRRPVVRGGPDALWLTTQALLVAGSAALAWFFFINKVYSPQYSVWIVVLLAAAGAPAALAVAWSAADLIYFMASFNTLALGAFQLPPNGPGPFKDGSAWFYHYTLLPAMVLREVVLLVVIGWALRWLWRPPLGRRHDQQPVGADPQPAGRSLPSTRFS